MRLQYADLLPEEQRVLDLYKANSPFLSAQCFADHLNQSLRSGQSLAPDWEQQALILDRVIDKTLSDEEVVIFRATFDDFVTPFVKDDEYVYPAYPSTGTDEYSVRRHFASALTGRVPAFLEIRCPPNTAMLDLELNASFGCHEAEILLGRRSRFKILSSIDVTDRSEIDEIMSSVYGKHYGVLKRYELLHVGRA